jgi:ribosomal protein S18 acetylase RimI-like enzyme
MDPAFPFIPSVTLRSAQLDDEHFLFDLYCSTRAEEIAAWGWNETQNLQFLELQFRAQKTGYAQYPNVDHRIILADGTPVGRLLVSRRENEIILVDIALLTQHRGRRIGGTVIRELLEEATRTGSVIQLHVEKSNRALQLYLRMRFEIVGDAGSHWLMRWRSSGNSMATEERHSDAG